MMELEDLKRVRGRWFGEDELQPIRPKTPRLGRVLVDPCGPDGFPVFAPVLPDYENSSDA